MHGDKRVYTQLHKSTHLKVLPNLVQYAYVKLKGLHSPCNINFTYLQTANMSIYVSTEHKLPDADNYHQARNNPKEIQILTSSKMKQFKEEAVYLAFSSDRECKVYIQIAFTK